MPHRLLRWIAAASALASMASRASAQVNVEGLRKELTGDGVLGKVNGSLTSHTGNTVGLELGATSLLAWRAQSHLAYLSTAANYAHLGGQVQVANAFAHLRYNRALGERLVGEAFTQAESDRFRRLRLRVLLGVGPRFTLHDDEFVGVFFGISYMYEHNALSPSIAPVRPSDVHRLNSYASLVIVLEPRRATITSTLYVQPRLDDARDLRLLEAFSLDVAVAGRVSAGLHATVRYENPVRRPIKNTDLVVKNTLGVVF